MLTVDAVPLYSDSESCVPPATSKRAEMVNMLSPLGVNEMVHAFPLGAGQPVQPVNALPVAAVAMRSRVA